MTYRKLPPTMYSDVAPTPVRAPRVLLFNDQLAETLGLDPLVWNDPALLSGNTPPDDFAPLAEAYAGHQFGYLTMLGDGRAHLIQEVVTPTGERVDIQLKGSGRTPYSRGGDGRATLGPMLREYLISEAMHALGIPTSRSLAVVATGETVFRDDADTGAILVRVAASHLRVGTLQYAAHQGVIREAADYAIERHDPACRNAANPYACFYGRVIERQADLIAAWQAVGFIHGVMNTDNMALSGETIDYGPCAFMDTYRADQVFSSIDRYGRYRYSHQPGIAKWNLARLGEALIPLLAANKETAVQVANDTLDAFDTRFDAAWLERFGRKLGLPARPEDVPLIERFLALLEAEKRDFTHTFRRLGDRPDENPFASADGARWFADWRRRVAVDGTPAEAAARMAAANPRVIPRNLPLEAALRAAESGDLLPFRDMLAAVQTPFAADVPAAYTEPPADDAPFVTYCGT